MLKLFLKYDNWTIKFLIIILLSLSYTSSSVIMLEGKSSKEANNVRVKRETKQIINDADIDGILSGFNEINNTLNKLSNTFANEPPEKCTLSYEKLLQLKEEIDDALTSDDQSVAINCDVNVDNPSGTCDELVKMIQCGINELSNALQDAIDNTAELAQLQKQYKELQDKYQKFLDDNESYISQEAQRQIDELKKQMQEQQDYINKLVNKLMREIIENISNKIQQNRISDAIDDFIDALDYKLDYEFITESIVERAYNQKYVENCLKFLKDLPIDEYSNKGYSKLIDFMTTNDELSSFDIFRYYEIATPDANYTERIKTFKNRLSDEYFKQVDVIAVKLRKDDHDDANRVLKVLEKKRYFSEDAIILAYKDTRYFEKILDSASSLKPIHDGACVGLGAIYDAMIINDIMDDEITEMYTFVLTYMLQGFEVVGPDPPAGSNEIASYNHCVKKLENVLSNLT